MTATLDHSSTALSPTQTGPSAPSQPRSRGRLVLEKRVVERVAAQAASESTRAGGVSGGFLGLGTRGDLDARPATTVELVGSAATVRLDLTVAYPVPIRQATEQVRSHVMDRVHELTGVEVTRVDITVVGLRSADTTPRELS